ncbi:MAG: DNA double-strand break repair nuclease NurA [Candidatus Micrarchaeota archaeon]|nr:DNA double-strand break repair nuclease NurA [Candidatus Micrarchaeota archaeon]
MQDGQELEKIARQIESISQERQQLASKLRQIQQLENLLEERLYYKVESMRIDAKVAAVDCGIVGEELHGFDFLVCRTAGVVFEYENGSPKKHSYYPSSLPKAHYDVMGGLENYEIAWHKGLVRLKSELSCAQEIVAKFQPDYLLLDGSIAPLVSDKPNEESGLFSLYQEVVQLYRKLYEQCFQSGCTLCGIIKDSRSRRFVELLGQIDFAKEKLRNATDSSFLFFLLNEGERTAAFRYSSSPSKHQVLKDLGEWAEKIASFYLRPAKEDRPLRVEFLAGPKTFSQIASFVHSLSCLHKAYAYPAILIEADLRAALDPEEFERAYSRLFSRLNSNPLLFRLRRRTRPFR